MFNTIKKILRLLRTLVFPELSKIEADLVEIHKNNRWNVKVSDRNTDYLERIIKLYNQQKELLSPDFIQFLKSKYGLHEQKLLT